MRAKAGKADALFELTTKLHAPDDADAPVEWVLCRSSEDPEVLWALELYRDEASFARHYANPVLDAAHDEVLSLLAEQPTRVDVRVVAAS